MNDLTVAELVDLHNSLNPHQPLTGWKKGKAQLIERIEELQENAAHAEAFLSTTVVEEAHAAESDAEPEATEPADGPEAAAEVIPLKKPKAKKTAEEKKPKGMGVGALARRLILEHPERTYEELASMVAEAIPGSKPTAASLRWYSNKMRKNGIEGTERVKPKKAETVADGAADEGVEE